MFTPITDAESLALIGRISSSRVFKVAPKQIALLNFLYNERAKPIESPDIEVRHYKRPKASAKHNPAHARERISNLKARLLKYAEIAVEEAWRCDLPDGNEKDGYQLEFKPTTKTPSQLFWQPHLQTAKDTILVTGSHLFFFDIKQKLTFRYYDVNMKVRKPGSPFEQDELRDLKAAHKDCDTTGLEPWHNVYLASGDIHTYEVLLAWFHKHSGLLLRRVTSRDISDKEAHRLAPIMIGRMETNSLIERLMMSPQAAHLRYRFSSGGKVRIAGMKKEERVALSDFTVSKNGEVSSAETGRIVFGLVTRLPNPSGYGHITLIISDYYANVIARIAETLTDDNLSSGLLQRMGWPVQRELPGSFEMLFAVTLSPGNLEGEGYPQLLCWSH